MTVDEVAGAGTGSPDVNLTTTSAYDALGRTSTTTDPKGIVTKFAYDRLGRLTDTWANYLDGMPTSATSDDDVHSTFAYDAASEMTGFCSAVQVYATGCDPASGSNAQAWHYGFDDAGRMARQTPPVNTTATALVSSLTEYDAGGRQTKACDGPSTITTCASAGVLRTDVPTYDALGRTTRLDTYSGPSTTLAQTIDTTFDLAGQTKQVKYSTGPSPSTVIDTIDLAYDGLGRRTKVQDGSTVLSESSYNPDGTLASRKDGKSGSQLQSSFSYDWAKRLTQVDLPSGFSSADPSFGWRLDGLVGSRTWSGTSATFGYDAAKRVTSLTKGSLSLGQAYDRDGNVTAESRSFPGVSGDPGTGTQSFAYDALGRVTGSPGLASGSTSYAYDRDGNRLTRSDSTGSYSYVVDRTDELVRVTKGILPQQAFAYDPYGNLTSDAESGTATTALSYDLAGHLTGIDPAGTANDTTFSLDALGRFATRTVNGTTDNFDYVGEGETVTRITTGSTVTDSLVSPSGDRLGVKVGSTLDWFIPDLHGDVAGAWDAAEATVVDALRYDAWGGTTATGSAGGSPVGTGLWKYQGRLDVSPAGLSTPLYDMSARFYSPGIGAFTQLDSVLGSAQDPLSMNRFLYAEGNPATLIDPSGHMAMCATSDSCDETTAIRYRTTTAGRDAARRISRRDHGRDRDSGRGRTWIRQATRDRQYDAAEAQRQALSTPAIPTNRLTAADIRRNGRQNLGAGDDVFGDIDLSAAIGAAVCNVTLCAAQSLVSGLLTDPVYTLGCFMPSTPCALNSAIAGGETLAHGTNQQRAELVGTYTPMLGLAVMGGRTVAGKPEAPPRISGIDANIGPIDKGVVYRNGSRTAGNLIDGGDGNLSTRSSISNPRDGPEIFKYKSKYQRIDVSKLPKGSVVADSADGHVSILQGEFGITFEDMIRALVNPNDNDFIR